MSAASVTEYLSPTKARKRAIRSCDKGGMAAAGFTVFMGRLVVLVFLLCCSASADRGAAQPVVDRFAEAVVWHAHHGDAARALAVEATKIAEKVGGGFRQIATLGKIHHRNRRVIL